MEKMSHKKEFKWLDRSHTVKGVIHNYDTRLPVIVKVVQGFCGIDDDDEFAYSAGEIYRLEEVREQNKLIFKNGQGQFFSIPENYQSRFQIVYDRGQRGPLMSLYEIQNKLDLGMKVEIEKDGEQLFKFPILGESQVVSASLGILQYEEFYTEMVLVGRPLIDANPQPEQVEIPSFVDIQLSLANGLEGGSDYDYDKVCADIAQLCKKMKTVKTVYSEEIMLVTCDIDELTEEYRNITPVHYVRCDQIKSAIEIQKSVEKMSKQMMSSKAYITKQRPVAAKRQVKLSPNPAPKLVYSPCNEETSDGSDYEEPFIVKPNSPTPPPLPPAPSFKRATINRRKLPAPPPESSERESRRSVTIPSPITPLPTQDMRIQPVISESNREMIQKHEYTNKVNPVSPMTTASDTYDAITDDLVDSEGDDYLDMSTAEPPSGTKPPGSPNPSVLCSSSKEIAYKSLAEVPQKVSDMSIEQVGSCLRLLMLNKYVDRFAQECIDGSMLTDIDRNMLVDDFKFSSFECQKLLKFISGWRPKFQGQL